MGTMGKKIGHIIGNVVSLFISLIVLIPLVVLLVNSFKTSAEADRMTLSLPKQWMFENYSTVIEQGKLISSFFNGLLYATGSVVIIVAVVSLAAFVISRNMKGINRALYYFIISGIAMPINNVSLMKVMQAFHLVNTRFGIILLYAAINIPLSLFLAYGFIETIPREIDEAAVIDGATAFQKFKHITVPLAAPTIRITVVMCLTNGFREFDTTYLMTGGGPVNSTHMLSTYSYKLSFEMFKYSKGSAVANILLVILMIVGVFYLKATKEDED